MSRTHYSEPENPVSFNKPDRDTLLPDDLEGLGKALLSLSKEVWVMKDRMIVLEKILENHGINAAEEIDKFQPDEALQSRLNEEGKDFVADILDAMKS